MAAHLKRYFAVFPLAIVSGRLRIEMIVSRDARDNLPLSGDPETLGIRLICLHKIQESPEGTVAQYAGKVPEMQEKAYAASASPAGAGGAWVLGFWGFFEASRSIVTERPFGLFSICSATLYPSGM